jgi:peptidoglycan/LPS O-acetylase OafA/YrhL
MPARESLRTLSSLRFFAAYAVFAYHLLPYVMGVKYVTLPEYFTRLLECAYVGMPFFFVLSGFVLYHAYRPRIPQSARSIGKFFGRRFARIAPFFYLSLLLGALTVGERHLSPGRLAFYGAVNLGFFNAWLPNSLVFNYPSWSVSVEACCYLAFPFLMPAVLKLTRSQAWLALALAFAAGAAFQLVGVTLYPDLWRWPWIPGTVNPAVPEFFSVSPLAHVPSFLFGLALARIHDLSEPLSGRRADLLLAGGVAAVIALLEFGPRWPFVMITSFLFLPLHAALLLGGAGTRGPGLRWLESAWAVELGESTYVLYVLHMPLYALWNFLLPAAPPAFTGAIFLLGLPALSVALHRGIEIPARDFLNRRFSGNTA